MCHIAITLSNFLNLLSEMSLEVGGRDIGRLISILMEGSSSATLAKDFCKLLTD